MVSCASCGRSQTKKSKEQGITFHTFPRDEERRRLWLKAVDKNNWQPGKHSTLCSQHFTLDCFDRTSKMVVRLYDVAVPSIKIHREKYVRSVYPYNETTFRLEPEKSSATPSVVPAGSTASASCTVADTTIKTESEESPTSSVLVTSSSATLSTSCTIIDNTIKIEPEELSTPIEVVTSSDSILRIRCGAVQPSTPLTVPTTNKTKTPDEIQLQRKINEMAKVDILKSKKIRLLQKTVWHQRKRIESLKNVIKEQKILNGKNGNMVFVDVGTKLLQNIAEESDPLR